MEQDDIYMYVLYWNCCNNEFAKDESKSVWRTAKVSVARAEGQAMCGLSTVTS